MPDERASSRRLEPGRFSELCDRVETALQRVPYNIEWIADEGEPAMEALREIRELVGEGE